MKKRLSSLLLMIILVAGNAAASHITLNTTVNSQVVNDTLKVSISAVNRGDEPAYHVQAVIKAGRQKIATPKKQQIGVGESFNATSSVKLDLEGPGQYPLVITIHYTDANQYPFSALNLQTFSYKTEPIPSDIFGKMNTVSFWKKGQMKLTLKNLGASESVIRVYLEVPKELTSDSYSVETLIPSKSEKEAGFTIHNFSALSGSTYRIFAVSEYEKEGVHFTSITPGTVTIVEQKSFFEKNYVYLIMVLVILIILFVIFQIRKK